MRPMMLLVGWDSTSLFMASRLISMAYGRITSYSIAPTIKQTQWQGWPLTSDRHPGISTAMLSTIPTNLPLFRSPRRMFLKIYERSTSRIGPKSQESLLLMGSLSSFDSNCD